jgi:hypothetical protein
MEVPEEQRQRLRELVMKSRMRLSRWPSWISSGSQAEFDEWLVGGDQAAAIKRRVRRETVNSF